MNRILTLSVALVLSLCAPLSFLAQTTPTLSHDISPEERLKVEQNGFERIAARGITTPPEYDNIRTAAEWEEVEALTIAWEGFECILTDNSSGC